MDLELEFAKKLITGTAYLIAVVVLIIIILESVDDDDTGW